MIELQGKYNIAKIFTDNIENEAISQVIDLCNQEFVKDSKIRIMPDCHSGAGCTIGTTITIRDKVVPSLVGYDIGCSVLLQKIKEKDIDLELFDKAIRQKVPSGASIRATEHELVKTMNVENALLDKLKCKNHIDKNRALLSVGTLGGGELIASVSVNSW